MRHLPGLALALALSLLVPHAASAAPAIVVGKGTPASCTEQALRAGLMLAETAGGIVKFKCGGGPVTIALTATLVPPHNTIIDGGTDYSRRRRHLLLPSQGVTVFSVDGNATVVLKNLVISGGEPSDPSDAGAILNRGRLTIKDSTISDNFAPTCSGGSAIQNLGTLTISDSTISDNASMGSGFNAAGIHNVGTLTINDSTVSGNFSKFDPGVIHNEGSLTINNSTFSGNASPENTFSVIFSSGDMLIRNSMFSDNFGSAGAVGNSGTLAVKNSTFSGNGSSVDGGGAIRNGGTLTVKNSAFSHNFGGFDGGGAIARTSARPSSTTAYFRRTARHSAALSPTKARSPSGTAPSLATPPSLSSPARVSAAASTARASSKLKTPSSLRTSPRSMAAVSTRVRRLVTLKRTSVTGNTPNDIVP